MSKHPDREERGENQRPAESAHGGRWSQKCQMEPEHAELHETYSEVLLLLWEQGKGLKIFKQNSGIIKFRFYKNHYRY